jgi:hypothetical protein
MAFTAIKNDFIEIKNLYLDENYKPYRYFCVLFMNTKTKGKLRLKKGIFKIRVGKFYDSHLATLQMAPLHHYP